MRVLSSLNEQPTVPIDDDDEGEATDTDNENDSDDSNDDESHDSDDDRDNNANGGDRVVGLKTRHFMTAANLSSQMLSSLSNGDGDPGKHEWTPFELELQRQTDRHGDGDDDDDGDGDEHIAPFYNELAEENNIDSELISCSGNGDNGSLQQVLSKEAAEMQSLFSGLAPATKRKLKRNRHSDELHYIPPDSIVPQFSSIFPTTNGKASSSIYESSSHSTEPQDIHNKMNNIIQRSKRIKTEHDRVRENRQKISHANEAFEISLMDSSAPSSIEVKEVTYSLPTPVPAEEFAAIFEEVISVLRNRRDCSKETIMSQMEKERVDLSLKFKRLRKEREKARVLEAKKRWNQVVGQITKSHHKAFKDMHSSRVANAKKFVFLTQKEVQKRVRKTLRSVKDAPNRSRKFHREMTMFWRRYDKEIAETRKRAEKLEEEKRKIEDEIREVKRQQRKLNFLLTQTELYSHFVRSKVNAPTPDSFSIPFEMKATKSMSDLSGFDDGELTVEKARTNAESAARAHIEKMQQFDVEADKFRGSSASRVPDLALASPSPPSPDMAHSGSEPQHFSLNDTSMLNPSSMPTEFYVRTPRMFQGELKSYQLKGLNWLVNCYEQGINGILADEMGLGKTIQTMAFLAHLAEEKGIWGPFMIIAPTSTLHNWHQEFLKFVPEMKVLPYWGSAKDRKILRKHWNPKKLYTQDSTWHVMITSYRLVVDDEKYVNRIKWQYLILDEAHAIKSSSSIRWKTLLSFKCRNRLLLTGTPIQNSMAELWALLHFVMPTLFDSHEEFNEWFSKDIEAHAAENQGNLNAHQLTRLHMILKPFMLRRVKKDVEGEMPPKVEIDLFCSLSERQRRLYKAIKDTTYSALLETLNSPSDTSLMNLVMQFRKVCNHPELFERQTTQTPLQFQLPIPVHLPELPQYLNSGGVLPTVPLINENPIRLVIPRLFWHHCFGLIMGLGPGGTVGSFERHLVLFNRFNIFHSDYIHRSLLTIRTSACAHTTSLQPTTTATATATATATSMMVDSPFSFLRFIHMNPEEASFLFKADLLDRWLVQLHLMEQEGRYDRALYAREQLSQLSSEDTEERQPRFAALIKRSMLLVRELENPCAPLLQTHRDILSTESSRSSWRELVVGDPVQRFLDNKRVIRQSRAFKPPVFAPPIELFCHDRNFANSQWRILHDGWKSSILHGFACNGDWSIFPPIQPPASLTPAAVYPLQVQVGVLAPLSKSGSIRLKQQQPQQQTPPGQRQQHLAVRATAFTISPPHTAVAAQAPHPPALTTVVLNDNRASRFSLGYLEQGHGLDNQIGPEVFGGTSPIFMPSINKTVADSGKLKKMDELLRRLKHEGHRVLIFCQMTRMLDILEEYMQERHYTYCRFDGSSNIQERKILVKNFQTKPDIFVFLLSTRAGGLGINLTAADTVIFYDSDWNPTSDAQAMDRVHRIGQTRKVTVYRMVCKGTIEERILKRAKQKNTIQTTVYSGQFKAEERGPAEEDVMSLLLDDMEAEETLINKARQRALQQQIKRHGKRRSDSILTGDELASALSDGTPTVEPHSASTSTTMSDVITAAQMKNKNRKKKKPPKKTDEGTEAQQTTTSAKSGPKKRKATEAVLPDAGGNEKSNVQATTDNSGSTSSATAAVIAHQQSDSEQAEVSKKRKLTS